MSGRRKLPFSGKKKKQQLAIKNQRKRDRPNNDSDEADTEENDQTGDNDSLSNNIVLYPAPSCSQPQEFRLKFFQSGKARGSGKYALNFRCETKEELHKLKAEARKEVTRVEPEYLECSSEDFFPQNLDFPIRPAWNYELSKEQLNRNEQRYFNDYLLNLERNFEVEDLSYFELNLETWRQLWRVLEMSDILLCVVDCRFPVLLFPPKLYEYVTQDLKKSMILILNKIDLVPAHLVVAWKDYFTNRYPDLKVFYFTCYPTSNESGGLLKKKRKRPRRPGLALREVKELYEECSKIVNNEIDISDWKSKIDEDFNLMTDEADEDEEPATGSKSIEAQDTSFYKFIKYKDNILTIGCVGQPNTGKSSFINALMGKKVVSVSRTPGHTKTFQTIFLSPSVRLCDCPGLIFPSRITKQLQVLCGSYPISQLREPYTTIKYLAERVNLVGILGLPSSEAGVKMTAYCICDEWAKRRGYYTANVGRLDQYRSANDILRLALSGAISLSLRPPGFTENEVRFRNDTRVPLVEAKKRNYRVSSSSEQCSGPDILDEIESDSSSHSDSDGHEVIKVSNKFEALEVT